MRKLAAIAVIGAILGIVADMAVVRDSNCGPAPPRSMCNNNLKQIVLGLHYYHDQYGAFPPAFIADSDGTPIHSWRVLILPFIGE